MELLSDLENGYSTPQPKESTTLLMMFDRVASSESCPVFAASDLASLPLVMIGNNPDGTQVFDEIQQIRFFIQNAMLAKETHKEIKKARPQPQTTPKHSESSSCPTVSASSPESVTPIKIKQEASSISSVTNLFNGNGIDVCNLLRLTAFQANMLQHSPSKKRNFDQGNRLDRAVRKLTDRLEAKSEPKEIPTGSLTPENGLSNSRPVSNVSAMVENNATNGNNVTNGNNGSSIFGSTNLLPNIGDPMTYVQMLKNLTAGCANNVPIYPIPSAVNLGVKQEEIKTEENIIVDGDEGMEDDDKMSNESSPTPSDSSRNSMKDDQQSDDKNLSLDNADKPFTCEQPNCQKRFANKFLLKKHQFIHTGLRPHMCPFCQKRFNRKDNLLRHKKTHLANAMASLEGHHRRRGLGFSLDKFGSMENGEDDDDGMPCDESS
uniref:C2H2-type domain-containing protein n=1 Tax=Acrobeloides nanus TaxID=290746 RepID=A0A914BZH5_9BILA